MGITYNFHVGALFALIVAVGHDGYKSVGAQLPVLSIPQSNFSLYGAIIISDKKTAANYLFHLTSGHCLNSTSNWHDSAHNITVHSIFSARKANVKKLTKHLKPLKLQYWPTVHTRPCPVALIGSNTENNLDNDNVTQLSSSALMRTTSRRPQCPAAVDPINHLQIWMDFVYFDPDMLAARKRTVPEYLMQRLVIIVTVTSAVDCDTWVYIIPYSSFSVSGLFQSHANGSIHKNGRAFLDKDVIVILHDSVVVRLSEHCNGCPSLYESISSEVTRMRTDLLLLGWEESDRSSMHDDCYVDVANTIELSYSHRGLHAYALSRAGARKLVQLLDPCGGWDVLEQIRYFACNGLVTCSCADTNLFVLP